MSKDDAINEIERELNETLKSARATTYTRATREYDPEFEHKVFAAIIQALTAASFVQVANVALRTGETIAALMRALACVIALPPYARSPTLLRKYVDELNKTLRRKAMDAAAAPVVRKFKRRTFNGLDVGGRA